MPWTRQALSRQERRSGPTYLSLCHRDSDAESKSKFNTNIHTKCFLNIFFMLIYIVFVLIPLLVSMLLIQTLWMQPTWSSPNRTKGTVAGFGVQYLEFLIIVMGENGFTLTKFFKGLIRFSVFLLFNKILSCGRTRKPWAVKRRACLLQLQYHLEH